MKGEESLRQLKFSRRSLLTMAGQLGVLSLLGSRMFYLQIIKGREYRNLAEGNRVRLFLICPPRGNIYDCNDELIAGNKNHYRLLFDGSYASDADSSLQKLFSLLNFTDHQKEQITNKVMHAKEYSYILIGENLGQKEITDLEVNQHDMPGMFIDSGIAREYYLGNNAAHLLGYVGLVNEKELKANPLLSNPDYRIGKDGIEKIFEDNLRGEAGIRKVEVNARGEKQREIATTAGTPGKSLKLTINSDLQAFVSSILPVRGSSGVVLDVTNGHVLALASKPDFDPNILSKSPIPYDYWQNIINDPAAPLLNKVSGVQYPPGSIYKLVVVLAALEAGVKPDTVYNCPGYMMLGSHSFGCHRHQGHGSIDMLEGLKYSCNVYMFNLAKRIGIAKIAETARKLGYGQKTGLQLPGEAAGVVADKEWKLMKMKKPWTMGDTLNSAIGQGFNLASPLQMALATAQIASGKLIRPTLVYGQDIAAPYSDGIKDEHFALVRQAMHDVVNAPDGTATYSRLSHPEHKMAGKTATAQVVSKKRGVKQDLSSHSTPFEIKNHGMFTAFAPFDNPKYALTILVEHGGSGSGAAAPLAKQIMEKLLIG